ncbi:hypothetical protein LTR91_011459 [Friedmanniomyces endolithicus]|uniref:Cystathionine gamma-synthase n=1 Tax=Friedmanniomyces endolithicus TaxID=329885 RepID=A0AAN6KH61_9PEZI|nr:hypothetical protein LTR91_011459 [Friedmanniomyces endolithicus]
MAETGDGKQSGRSRFLSKSKWGKVFKEQDAPPSSTTGKVNSFKLNEDVVDFLKPSTEKSKPKIDIALAQRWPSAHEVRKASESGTTPTLLPWSGYRKPRRRAGLAVGFARTAPEVIGEGGDEAMEPVAEISRKKAAVGRSVSARVPGDAGEGVQGTGSTQVTGPQARQTRMPNGLEEQFRPPPVRRTQTSHNEFSLPLQRKLASPPLPVEEPVFHRPSLGRAATGFSSQSSGGEQNPADYESDEEEAPAVPQMPTALRTQFHRNDSKDVYDSPTPMTASTNASAKSSAPSGSAMSPVAQNRQRDMQAKEGKALRRASTQYMQEEKEDHEKFKRDTEAGFLPSPHFYNTLSNISTSSIAPEPSAQTQQSLSPEMALTPGGPGPSPFGDPRYLKRHSGEMAATEVGQTPHVEPVAQSSSGQQASYVQTQSPEEANSVPVATSFSRPIPGPGPRRERMVEPPSYMRAAQQATMPPQPPHDPRREASGDGRPSYMRATQPPEAAMAPTRPTQASSQNMSVPQGNTRDGSRSPMRDGISGPQDASEKPRPFYSQANHSSGSLDRVPGSPKFPRSRDGSREESSPQMREPSSAGSLQSPPFYTPGLGPASQSPRGTLLNPTEAGRSAPSPYARGPSPADYFSAPRVPQPPRSPAVNLRDEETGRPGSSGSGYSAYRPIPSPQPPVQGDHTAELALADFAGRVSHMKGVFQLTAERERSAKACSPQAWLRAALWWYARGKAELEVMLQQRSKAPGPPRELLTQAHVNIAKAWWIVSEQLESHDTLESPQSTRSPTSPLEQLPQAVAFVRSHLKSLCASMQKSQLMPPHQSLIQGQDTSIWLEYPRFTPDAAAVLGGAAGRSLIAETSIPSMAPLDALPLGDTRDVFCYGRFPVEVSLNTDEADTDRVVFKTMLSMLRNKRSFQPSIVIASQSELVSLNVGPRRGDERGQSWHDVSWKAGSQSVTVHLPRGFDLTVRMQERDFCSLSNLVEHSRRVEQSLRPGPKETLVHEARLAELQYADSSGAHAFPAEKLRSCLALVFEQHAEHRDGSGMRKMHRGFRLLLATEPMHKSLSSVSHELCQSSPLLFEFITDAAAGGTTAMVIRIRDEGRQCRILLVFPDAARRQTLYDVMNGLDVGPDEAIVGKMGITGFNIQDATQSEGFSPSDHSALPGLQWQKLGVTNYQSNDRNTRIPSTIQSESLRVVARHAAGCITDRLNLGKGELLFRLPCAATPTPTIQLLREPQEDLGMSTDTRQCPQSVIDGTCELYHLAQQHLTIRTLTFSTPTDLHAFQASITGFTVTYDGAASTFGISHRMNMVPIYQKKQASNVRLQIVEQGNITQVLAFMEDFALADALCFQVKSTDTFEGVKGDGKGRKWGVKFVDAKFRLPPRLLEREKSGEVERGERVRRRFVNLEGLDTGSILTSAAWSDDDGTGAYAQAKDMSDAVVFGVVAIYPEYLTWRLALTACAGQLRLGHLGVRDDSITVSSLLAIDYTTASPYYKRFPRMAHTNGAVNGNPNTSQLQIPDPPQPPTYSLATLGVHADDPIHDYSDVAPALHVATTFRYPSNPDQLNPVDDLDIPNREPGSKVPGDAHIYSRLTAPNSSRLELLLTSLIGAPCLTYSFGLAAFHALLVYLHPKVVAIGAGYHGCHGVLAIYQKLTNCKIVDLFDEKSWDNEGEGWKLGKGDVVHLETPVNPTGRAFDIQHYAELAHKRGAVLTIDATFAPPPLQDPFKWGADYVMHSGTKYFGGHSDMLCGIIAIGKNREGWEKDYWAMFGERLHLGAVMGSLEGWLGVRSLRTFELRVMRQSQNADKIVAFIDDCMTGVDASEDGKVVKSVVAKIEHASLQREDAAWLKKQMPSGFGPVFSISFKTAEQARRFPSKLQLFHHATSLGGVESLIEWRRMSDNTVEPELCRVSVGAEAWEDLRDDLLAGFKALAEEAK